MPKLKPIIIPGLIGGLNSGAASSAIALTESPRSQNFTVKDGVARKRTGYADNTGEVFDAKVSATESVSQSASVSKSISASVSKSISQSASVTGTGTKQTDTQTDTSTGTATDTSTETATQTVTRSYTVTASGSTSGSVPASAAKFFHGHHYQDGVSGEKRFWMFGEDVRWKDGISDDWYNGYGTCSFLTSGADDYYFTTTEIVELDDYKNYLIATHADTRRVGGTFKKVAYTSSPTEPLKNLTGGDGYSGSGTAHYCKRAINFANHLLLLHTLEHLGGSWRDMFQRVRFSDLSAFIASADWDDVNTDAAGYEDLKTDYGAIMNGDVLLNNLSVYMEEAIYAGYSTGSSTAPFHFEPKITGVGLYAPRLLASNGEAHFFVGSDNNIYQYWGGLDKMPIGDNIKTEFFSNMNKAANGNYLVRDRSWAFTLKEIEAVVFAIPTGSGNTDPTLYYVYFWRDKRWDKWDYLDTICGMGNYERPAAQSASNMPIFSDDIGNMFQLDFETANDEVTAIDAQIETLDIIVDLKNEHRTMNLWFEASGDGSASSVSVQASVDGGTTFSTAQSITVGTGWDLKKADFNVTGYMVRFKFSNAVKDQKLLLKGMRAELQEMNPKQ